VDAVACGYGIASSIWKRYGTLDVTPEPRVPLMLARSSRRRSPLLPQFLRLVRECFPLDAPLQTAPYTKT